MHILLNAGKCRKNLCRKTQQCLSHIRCQIKGTANEHRILRLCFPKREEKGLLRILLCPDFTAKRLHFPRKLFRRRRARVGGRSGDHLGAQRGNLPRGYSMRLICHHADHADQPPAGKEFAYSLRKPLQPIFIMAAVEQHKRLRLKHLQPRRNAHSRNAADNRAARDPAHAARA